MEPTSARAETAPAKILADFAKEHELPKIKAAVVDGRLFDDKAIKTLDADGRLDFIFGKQGAQKMRDIFLQRRDLIVRLLNQVPGVTCLDER